VQVLLKRERLKKTSSEILKTFLFIWTLLRGLYSQLLKYNCKSIQDTALSASETQYSGGDGPCNPPRVTKGIIIWS
jgi:hypothetical protein